MIDSELKKLETNNGCWNCVNYDKKNAWCTKKSKFIGYDNLCSAWKDNIMDCLRERKELGYDY